MRSTARRLDRLGNAMALPRRRRRHGLTVRRPTSHPAWFDALLTEAEDRTPLLRPLTPGTSLVWLLLRAHRRAVIPLREVVIKFLKEHPAYVCAECLASRLEAPVPPTTMITLGLHRADGFRSEERRVGKECRCR